MKGIIVQFTFGIADPHLALSIWMLSDRWSGLFQSVSELPDWSEGGNVGFPDGTAFEYDNWDELITSAFNESDSEIQEVLYYEAQRVFAESHRLMFMFNEFDFNAQRTWVNNWYYNMAMGTLFTVGASITLSKTMRDEHESQKIINRIKDVKTEKILKEYNDDI